ncbi:MAG TPA: YbhB/YbcL family Raf kinase inhibitor-like protein [Anaerolineales bacterium]
MRRITLYFLLLTSIVLSACAPSSPVTTEQTIPDPLTEDVTLSIELTSSAFEHEAPIPPQYSCVGDAASSLKDISPALTWGEPPAGTQSFALIMDDPDAPGGTWIHWVLFNIPASARGLLESFPANDTLPDGSMSGNNSWGRTGYGGPCPPSGTHRYFFKLYALDEMLAISPGASKGELEKAMIGHILARGELMGVFTK